jgi:glycosyltransferase involved in cell wall biosynthesis
MNATDLLDLQPQQLSTQHSALSTSVSVVVPLLNEAESLRPLYQEIDAAISEMALRGSAEIIFIDDGSTDGSMAVLRELYEADGRIQRSSSSGATSVSRRRWRPASRRLAASTSSRWMPTSRTFQPRYRRCWPRC